MTLLRVSRALTLLYILACLSTIGLLKPRDVHGQAVDQHRSGLYVATEAGATCTQATLSGAITIAAGRNIPVWVPTTDRSKVACTWDITSNFSPAAELIIPKGARINVATGVTLTLNACPFAGRYQIFGQANGDPIAGTVAGLSVCDAVLPEWFGATGDGTTDDTAAIQAAINSIGSGRGVVQGHKGSSYRIARTTGTNDVWGLTIQNSNITLRGFRLRRFNTDIASAANAYPILFIGTPDSDGAAATENTIIEDCEFTGEDTRHSDAGGTPDDLRTAIEVKNTKGTVIQRNRFLDIDSSAIYFQAPRTRDYANSVWYNTTKNYNAKILHNDLIGAVHATVNRQLLHAIVIVGVDEVLVQGNFCERTDDCVSGSGTYEHPDNVETDTWIADTVGAVKRTGRGWRIIGNKVLNATEHPFYLAGVDVLIQGNEIRCDQPTLCTVGPAIDIRSRGAVISGNIVSGYPQAIGAGEPSLNVAITGNTVYCTGTLGACIHLDSTGLSDYIDSLPYLTIYYPVGNITVAGNSITLPEAASTGTTHLCMRIGTDTGDANYPEGTLIGVSITGNTCRNHRGGIYFLNDFMRRVSITGNVFEAKPFTTSGFTAGTTLNTEWTLVFDGQNTTTGIYVSFTGNKVHGSTYLFGTDDGAGTDVHLPWGITGNQLSYIKNFRTADMRFPIPYNAFNSNSGNFFLDRTTWTSSNNEALPLQNGLGDGTTNSSYYKYNITYKADTGVIGFVIDDSSTIVELGDAIP